MNSRTWSSDVAAVVALLLLVACCGCDHNSQNATKPVAGQVPDRGGPDASAPVVDTATVTSHALSIIAPLPGELQPYEAVAIYAKVTGFVRTIGVDRGSRVHTGQLLATLEAPELTSQRAEAEAKVASAESSRTETEAKTAADDATYRRLKAASETPGVVSDNELQIAQQLAAGDHARQRALQQNVEAARATLKSVEEIGSYLRILAPFDGVVTTRNVHPGALVGPGGGASQLPMLNISQISRLRLSVAVPEAAVAYIKPAAEVTFTVASYPNETFRGKVARLADSVDVKTRTMPVELDVDNSSGKLSPGMYAQILWPEQHREPTLFVPASAVVRSMQGTFVIRLVNGITAWVPVKTGVASGDQTQVFGDLEPGQQIALRGTEELRPGTHILANPVAAAPAEAQ